MFPSSPFFFCLALSRNIPHHPQRPGKRTSISPVRFFFLGWPRNQSTRSLAQAHIVPIDQAHRQHFEFHFSQLSTPFSFRLKLPRVLLAMASDAKSTGSTKVDAIVQKVKAAEPDKLSGFALYSRFALAGAVCCSVTHGGLTPVDVYVVPLHCRPFAMDPWLCEAGHHRTLLSCVPRVACGAFHTCLQLPHLQQFMTIAHQLPF